MAKVPSLSSNGWLSEISERADALIAYYFTSDFSQSYIYQGQVTSLTYHIQNYSATPDRLENRIQSDLSAMLSRYFNNVDLACDVSELSEDQPDKLNVTIEGSLTDNGFKYDIGRAIRVENNRVTKISAVI